MCSSSQICNLLKDMSAETVDSIVIESWQAVAAKVENGHPVSSEKTLCFLLAMEIRDRCGSHVTIDFENQCYDGLQGESKYLDLLLYSNPNFKVAIEVKLPQRTGTGNSNQTQTREAVYRDIARLNYLKSNGLHAAACFFVMATNEHPYLNDGNRTRNPQFKTHDGHTILVGNGMTASELPVNDVACSFIWQNVTRIDSNRVRCMGRYAWLNPIKV